MWRCCKVSALASNNPATFSNRSTSNIKTIDMANGVYGTKMPANITSNDVDIFYFYRPSRSSDSPNFSGFKKLDSTYLTETEFEENGSSAILPGMYNLRLPLEEFSEKGIYTIYIKPKEILTKIIDVSTLAAYPNVRGIVLQKNDLGELANNGNLVGFRVEYLEGNERTEEFRLITSNNSCEPVAQSFNNSSQKGIRYVFNDSSDLTFCTLTPSTAMSFKSSSMPNIGRTNQEVLLINTKFNPVMFEIEMIEHDIESISTMLEGKQIRNLNKGLITTFNGDDEIYHQAAYGNITNVANNINHDFKLPNTGNIDFEEKDKLDEIEKNI